jgi:hypothetical protein
VAPGLHRDASTVLSAATLLLILAFLAACIIPPALEVEVDDAGVNPSPNIVSSASPFEFPGPFTLARDDTDATISLTIVDSDLAATMFVRLFLDYDPATGAGLVTECQAAPTGELARVVSCPATTICGRLDPADTNLHSLEAVAADQLWLTADDPDAADQDPLRAVPDGSLPSVRGWFMRCE